MTLTSICPWQWRSPSTPSQLMDTRQGTRQGTQQLHRRWMLRQTTCRWPLHSPSTTGSRMQQQQGLAQHVPGAARPVAARQPKQAGHQQMGSNQ